MAHGKGGGQATPMPFDPDVLARLRAENVEIAARIAAATRARALKAAEERLSHAEQRCAREEILAAEAQAWALRACSMVSGTTVAMWPSNPNAKRKVLVIPPPMITASSFPTRFFSTAILVDTLAPPTIATAGDWGASSAVPSASISSISSGPAADGFLWRGERSDKWACARACSAVCVARCEEDESEAGLVE